MQIWMNVELGSITAMKMLIALTSKGAIAALVAMDSLAME